MSSHHRFRQVAAASLALATASIACTGDDRVGESRQSVSLSTAPVLIDFDHTPAGAAVADGTNVGATYASLGVAFSSISCAATCVPAPAYARAPGDASPNSVSLFQTSPPGFNALYGAVEATFSRLASHVSIDSAALLTAEPVGTPTARPWMEAYDLTGALVGKIFSPIVFGTPDWSLWHTLTIEAPNIARVRFSAEQSASKVFARFDNLGFTRDGRLPTAMVLTGAPGWTTIPVATSNGDGTFATTDLPDAWWASTASTAGAKVAAGDFNGDGKPDLLLTGPGAWNTIPVALSNGGGTFTTTNLPNPSWATTASTAGASLISGDFDGDGKTDLVLTGPAGWNTVAVAFSNGDGTFHTTNLPNPWWAETASTAGVQIVGGDVDGDGKADLVLTGRGGWNTIAVAFSNGDGTFDTTNLPNPWWAGIASAPGARVVSGDFNGDGRADLLLTGPRGWNTIAVAFSNGDGTFDTTNLPNPWWAATAATPGVKLVSMYVNRDRKADLVLTGPGDWNTIPVALSNGNGTFATTNLPNPGWAAKAATPGASLVAQ